AVELVDQEVLPREVGAIRHGGLAGPVEGSTNADVSTAAAVDEVVHGARRPAGLVPLLVVLEVMGVARHDDLDLILPEQPVERGKGCGFRLGKGAGARNRTVLRHPLAREGLVAAA